MVVGVTEQESKSSMKSSSSPPPGQFGPRPVPNRLPQLVEPDRHIPVTGEGRCTSVGGGRTRIQSPRGGPGPRR